MEIFKDTDFVLSTEKTNKILALLTIIFTMSIPATAIGTIYGMNINLPGGIEAGAWSFWGRYTTLWVIATISIIPAVVMAFYFKKWHWL